MDRARKMVIVPLDRVEAQVPIRTMAQGTNMEQGEATVQTTGDPLTRLDTEMFDILKNQKHGSDHERAKQYLQVLRRYLQIRASMGHQNMPPDSIDNYRSEGEEEEEEEEANDTEDGEQPQTAILAKIPKTWKKKAEEILNHWARSNQIHWDKVGRVSIQGRQIKNSRVADWLNEVTRKRKTSAAPGGVDQMIDFIAESELPDKLIGNRDILKEIRKKRRQARGSVAIDSATQTANQENGEEALGIEETPKRPSQKRGWFNLSFS